MRALLEILGTIACGLLIGSILTLKLWAAPPEAVLIRSLWELLRSSCLAFSFLAI